MPYSVYREDRAVFMNSFRKCLSCLGASLRHDFSLHGEMPCSLGEDQVNIRERIPGLLPGYPEHLQVGCHRWKRPSIATLTERVLWSRHHRRYSGFDEFSPQRFRPLALGDVQSEAHDSPNLVPIISHDGPGRKARNSVAGLGAERFLHIADRTFSYQAAEHRPLDRQRMLRQDRLEGVFFFLLFFFFFFFFEQQRCRLSDQFVVLR